jgi:hypothetical protein
VHVEIKMDDNKGKDLWAQGHSFVSLDDIF